MEKLEVSFEQGMAADALDKSQVEQILKPEEVEAKLLKQEQDSHNWSEEELCSMVIKFYTPRYHQIIDNLSNRQLRRLAKALSEYPVGKEYKHPTQMESEAFFLGHSINQAKMVLEYKVYVENQENIMKAVEEANKNTTVEFTHPKEEANNVEN